MIITYNVIHGYFLAVNMDPPNVKTLTEAINWFYSFNVPNNVYMIVRKTSVETEHIIGGSGGNVVGRSHGTFIKQRLDGTLDLRHYDDGGSIYEHQPHRLTPDMLRSYITPQPESMLILMENSQISVTPWSTITD